MHEWDEIFGSDGPLARAVPGFTVRVEQIAMAEEVAGALRSRGRLVVEAGTGTGKTYAYLVPVLLSGKRVIVSTGTRTLQDQLFRRDLPTVTAALGRPVRVALLKGRANYLCLHRLELAEQQALSRGLRKEVATALPYVRDWSRITQQGDIAELSQFGEAEPVWPWVTSNRDNCVGTECPVFDRCHVMRARREAQAADVVIVNHHLLMADLVLKEEGFGDLLPGADAIVIDEAHQLPEVASMFLGFAVSNRQIEALARDLMSELVLNAAPTDAATSFTQSVERRLFDLQDAIGTGNERIEFAQWSSATVEALESLEFALKDIVKLLSNVSEGASGLTSVRRRAAELSSRLALILDHGEDHATSSVRWAQQSRIGVSVHYVPVDIAKQLGELIAAHSGAWICTSATLAVGDNFEHFIRRVGIEDPVTVRLESPFDFAQQALLYLPKALDPPSSRRYTQQVVDAALPVLLASGGRAFMLFTSHRALREAADILLRRLGPSLPFPVLVHGEAPRETLLRRFREHGNAVLLGTSSFWEGVDVVGEALSCLIIARLPFAPPTDPIVEARSEQFDDPFSQFSLPHAILRFRQGFGRLIRSKTDRGIMIVLDSRVR
ncbi:MAG: ATP-dependent DNA helicase, partial [Povalibacter sp.]